MSTMDGMTDATAKCVADHLVIACDHLAEAIAFMGECQPGQDSVMLAFKTLFQLRAELGLTGGMVVADLDDSAEYAEAAE